MVKHLSETSAARNAYLMALEGAPKAPDVHALEVLFATWFVVELALAARGSRAQPAAFLLAGGDLQRARWQCFTLFHQPFEGPEHDF